MTSFDMTRDEAEHLARYLSAIRKRLPGDDWDRHGIEGELAKARGRATSPDLACAAIRAAEIPTNRTPAVIGMDGPHWRESTAPPRPAKLAPGDRCTACSNAENHRLHTSGDHAFCRPGSAPDFDVAAITQSIKADLAAARGPLTKPAPRKTLDELARTPAVVRLREEMAAAQVAADEAIEVAG